MDIGGVSIRGDLRVELLLDDARQRMEGHAQRVGGLAVEPWVADRKDVDLLRSELDRDRDRRVVGHTPVNVVSAGDLHWRKDARNGAAREQRRHRRA